jgi:predicted nucleic acid-binding protein
VSSPAAFWDSSTLIPLCINQGTSVDCKALSTQFNYIVWWATAVEVRSAVARLGRASVINPGQRQGAIDRLSELRLSWPEVAPSYELRELAANLLDTYALRAADSLQLAAALTWCQSKPAGRVFVCDDLRLCDAAAQADFTVVRPGVTTP